MPVRQWTEEQRKPKPKDTQYKPWLMSTGAHTEEIKVFTKCAQDGWRTADKVAT